MKAKTELLLYHMLWAAEQVMRPTYRSLDDSFESWAYRNGLLQQIHRLEAQGLVESRRLAFDRGQVHRLTEAGRIAALGGRDPEEAWQTPWDHTWRLFLFDIPEHERSLRRTLTRTLKANGCGGLQGSVWIAPICPEGLREVFGEHGSDCSHLIMLEAASRGRTTDLRMVEAAWDFGAINARYRKHMATLKRIPAGKTGGRAALARWAAEENTAWLAAVRADPLLPASLLPKNYLGRRAWASRKTALRRAGGLARTVCRQA